MTITEQKNLYEYLGATEGGWKLFINKSYLVRASQILDTVDKEYLSSILMNGKEPSFQISDPLQEFVKTSRAWNIIGNWDSKRLYDSGQISSEEVFDKEIKLNEFKENYATYLHLKNSFAK